ncbi:cupin domain-containing protein [Streptomyces sp. TBY4]|uniref:cupin domain-containing protein n=1 Tax=Streptomyces sp. TBY4 TaxID=2962030 RepID=UPI0020B6A18C|nr:cupin domain-containing protein [Streptomyces sp. TBY4]MCP3760572.1 cupin domain-containing protein [Streptomyces sp. TBY4]
MTVTPACVVHLDDVKPIKWAGEVGRWLLRGEDTGGLFSFFEVTTPPGGGPPLHIHETVDETFFVIEGQYEFELDGAVHKVPQGGLVYGPRGMEHAFVNTWDRPSKMLCIATPGGIEDWFEQLGVLLEGGGPPDWEKMQALARKHNVVGLRGAGPGGRGGTNGPGLLGGGPGGPAGPGGPGGRPGGRPEDRG